MEVYKLAVIEDNPVHYRVGIYKEMMKFKELSHHVYFFSEDNMSRRYLFESKKKNMIKIDMNGFNYSVLKNYYKGNNINPPKGLWNFGIILEIMKGKYDAITIHGYSSFSKKLAILSAILSKTPIIFKEEINEMASGKIRQFFKKIFYRILFKIPSAFLCSYTKNEEFYRSFGIPKERCFLHPCAVDNRLYQKLAKKTGREDSRNKLKIPLSANVFLIVGTIDKRKDSFGILKAFEKQSNKNNWLIYLGEGPEKEKLKNYIRENKICNVKFFPFKPNIGKIAEFYSTADIFIIASLSDPSPKVLNEAMNFSLPIIASSGVGTASDLVKNNINGFLYGKGNWEELSILMSKILLNKKRMGKESLRIVSRWSFNEDVKATIKAIRYVK